MRQVLVALVLVTSACKLGGEYAQNARSAGDVDRGETNGRSFEFVSHKPEGDDWQIRIRDSSMSVGYGNEDTSESLKPMKLDKKETRKVWELVDAMEIGSRKKGKKDEDEGYVMLRLREPSDQGHEATTIFMSRTSEDEDFLALAEYLRTVISKYNKEKPNF